jgi:hypothetical protein
LNLWTALNLEVGEKSMIASRKVLRISGLVLHILIGALLIFAGTSKILGLLPPEAREGMAKYGIADKLPLIGTGEVITAILLIVPATAPLGTFVASGFWGGVICLHMSHDESYVGGSVLLLLTWLGAYLRNPHTFVAVEGQQELEAPLRAPAQTVPPPA